MVMHIPILKDLGRYVVLDIILFIIFHYRDFSDGPEVKILHSQSRGTGLIPGWGTKITHATRHKNK